MYVGGWVCGCGYVGWCVCVWMCGCVGVWVLVWRCWCVCLVWVWVWVLCGLQVGVRVWVSGRVCVQNERAGVSVVGGGCVGGYGVCVWALCALCALCALWAVWTVWTVWAVGAVWTVWAVGCGHRVRVSACACMCVHVLCKFVH